MEGGVSKYHSLPTVFSGNDYKATISANEVKRMECSPIKTANEHNLPLFTPLFLIVLLCLIWVLFQSKEPLLHCLCAVLEESSPVVG